jgi:hypothetical protein
MHAHYACGHGPDDDHEHDAWQRVVEAVALAYLSESGADLGAVVTIRAALVTVEDSDDVIAEFAIGVGRDAMASMAADHAAEELNRPGAPWNN